MENKLRSMVSRSLLGEEIPCVLNAHAWCRSTHWGPVTHICVGNINNIDSDNGLSPDRRQTIIWTSAGILLIWPVGTNFAKYHQSSGCFEIDISNWNSAFHVVSHDTEKLCMAMCNLNISDVLLVSSMQWSPSSFIGHDTRNSLLKAIKRQILIKIKSIDVKMLNHFIIQVITGDRFYYQGLILAPALISNYTHHEV